MTDGIVPAHQTQRFFLESNEKDAQAGLLTRFRYKHLPGNYPSGYWHFAYAFSETYSSGTVQDSHLDSLLIIHLGGEINEPMHRKDTVYI